MLAIVKFGGSLITDKRKPFKVRTKVLKRLSSEIKNVLDEIKAKIVIVHGGGSFGHYVAFKHVGKGITSQGFIEIHDAMLRLNTIVLKYLRREGVLAETIHTSSAFTLDNGQIRIANIDVIKGMIDKGIIPVLYGDVVYDKSKGFVILSGDTLVAYLANALDVNMVVFTTNVYGIYKRYPPKKGSRDLIELIDLRKFSLKPELSKHLGYDVTGGMLFKLTELKKYISCKRNMKIFIINGLRRDFLKNILLGRNVKFKTEIRVC